jgi:hypothetical protein
MTYLKLTGLRASLPIGAMAAFGTLRVCQRLPRWKGAKLGWERTSSSYQPVLYGPTSLGREELITDLIEDVRAVGQREQLSWADQMKGVSIDDFVKRSRESVRRAGASSREGPDWIVALGNDMAAEDELVASTPFDMSVARQKFPADALRLAASLADAASKQMAATQVSYEEALFGPWAYREDQHSFGWDPSTMKLGAFTHKAPTSMANAGIRAAVWLAFESLPLFPCFYDRELVTRSFRRSRRDVIFCWPIWEPPISNEELGTLLGWKELVAEYPDTVELRARGVLAVYRAKRFKPNKYLASFRSAEIAIGKSASK